MFLLMLIVNFRIKGSGDDFVRALTELAAMDEETLSKKRVSCSRYIELASDKSVRESGYRKIFG